MSLNLKDFNGLMVKATAINIYCVEDLDLIIEKLKQKHGEDPVDKGTYFLVAGQRIPKPWLQRERIGIFRLRGEFYCIENIEGSVDVNSLPKRSFYPVTNLQVIDDKTLLLILNKEKDYKIEYRVTE